MSPEQSRLLFIQAVLAGLQVLNMGLVVLETYKIWALVISALLAAGQFYVTHAANQTTSPRACRRCREMEGDY